MPFSIAMLNGTGFYVGFTCFFGLNRDVYVVLYGLMEIMFMIIKHMGI